MNVRAAGSVRPLRVCLYYPWLYLTSGGERTIVELATRSRHTWTIVTNEYQPDATFPELRHLDVRVLDRVPVKRSLGAVAQAAWRILTQRIDLTGFDALLVVCEGLGDLVVLRRPPVPALCLCLTPLRVVFDPVYRRTYLAGRGRVHRAAIRLGSAAFRLLDRRAWRHYDRVFAISREVQRRITDGHLATSSRVQLLHPGVDLSRFRPSPPRTRTFYVPGRIMWTKNLELAIEAFGRFRQVVSEPDSWRLCIAGIVDRKSEPYLARLRALAGDDAAIEFRVHPSDDEMRQLYADCYATLFTALNEDWGLVMIEALASGKPVVAVNRGGPLEIVRHEEDGLLAPPSVEQFAEAMRRLVEEPGLRDRLSAAAPAGAARFGWERFVEGVDDALAAAVSGRSSVTPGAIARHV
jgi:glycosyltransferase involved in cell wall biosynthesis